MPYTLMKGLGWFLAALRARHRDRLADPQRDRPPPGRQGPRPQHVDTVELERLRGTDRQPRAGRRRTRPTAGRARGRARDAARRPTRRDSALPDVAAAPDVSAASVVLGRPVVQDDLTVIPGISPTSRSCATGSASARGTTWRPPRRRCCARCSSMPGRASAPSIPSLWPEMARLLSDGRVAAVPGHERVRPPSTSNGR